MAIARRGTAAEAVDDRVAAFIAAGTNISATYDDTAGTLTIAASQQFFSFGPQDVVYSNVGWATFTQSGSTFYGGRRDTDNSNQNNEVVYALPVALTAGTWKFVLLHTTSLDRGIYTVAVSPDAAAWTDLTTIDGYSASSTANVRSEVTGLTVAAGMRFVRLKMATKNVSSTFYRGTHQLFTGVRTGA